MCVFLCGRKKDKIEESKIVSVESPVVCQQEMKECSSLAFY